MGRPGVVGLSGGQPSARSWRRALLSLGVMLAATPAPEALAQEALAQEVSETALRAPPLCTLSEYVEEGAAVEAGDRRTFLLAACSGSGINLGEIDRYSSSLNPGLDAMVVEIERLGHTRVVLLMRNAERGVIVEDLTGALSVAAGRSPTGGLRGLATDVRAFERDGTVGLTASAEPGQLAAVAAQRFDVAEHISDSEARRNAVRATLVEEGQ